MEVIGGRYELVSELGRGGMGVVHRARDRVLEREIALKFLAPWLADDPVFRERFAREARALARVRHPNVVQVHDSGEHEGAPWFAMSLCTGGSLAERVEGGPLGPPAVRAVAADALDALAAVHAAGLIHRDLKPGNILNENGRWLLSDFGIVREQAGARRDLTSTGLMIGTPEYWSPEHMGEGVPAAPADVYALGCVLYRALTGAPPYRSDNPMRVAMMHSTEPAPRLPDPVRAADPPLAELVGRMLDKDPEARPRAGDAARSLGRSPHEATLVGAPEPPAGKPDPQRTVGFGETTVVAPGRPRRRRRAVALFGSAALAVVLAASLAGAWLTEGGPPWDRPTTRTVMVDPDPPPTPSDATPAAEPAPAPAPEPAPARETPEPAPKPAPAPAPVRAPARAIPQPVLGIVGAGDVNPTGLPEADLGVGQAQLASMWGAPDYYDSDIQVSAWEGLDVIALGDPVRHFLVGSGSSKPRGTWATPSDAHVGMPRTQLVEIYGDRLRTVAALRPEMSAFDGQEHHYVIAGGRGLGFAIDRGRVAELLASSADDIEGVTSDAGTAIP